MQVARASVSVFFNVALTLTFFLSVGVLLPGSAHADQTFSIETAQVLPPGQTTACQTPQVGVFTPYVYDGALQSFDLSLSDPSYVAVVGSAGETSIPFTLMTRQIQSDGYLRIHADIDVPIASTLPVTVTLLSANGQVTCVSVISTTVSASEAPVSTNTPTTETEGPGATSYPSGPMGSGSGSEPGTLSEGDYSSAVQPPAGGLSGTATGAMATSVVSSSIGDMRTNLKDMCVSMSPTNLWVILLVIYAIIVAGATLGEVPNKGTYKTELMTAAVVVPLVLLFGLWYFADSCRTGAWVPVVTIVIALVGLYAAFRKSPQMTSIIPLPAGSSQPSSSSTSNKK